MSTSLRRYGTYTALAGIVASTALVLGAVPAQASIGNDATRGSDDVSAQAMHNGFQILNTTNETFTRQSLVYDDTVKFGPEGPPPLELAPKTDYNFETVVSFFYTTGMTRAVYKSESGKKLLMKARAHFNGLKVKDTSSCDSYGVVCTHEPSEGRGTRTKFIITSY